LVTLNKSLQKPDTIQFDPDVWILRDVTKTASSVADYVIPSAFELYQNYLNPFNPSTTFRFALGSMSRVRILIYTELGQLADVIHCGEMDPGYHTKSWHATLASDLYFYRLEATPTNGIDMSYFAAKKMLIIR
jgi:hypothetical protein